jgi:phosphoglycerate dehydrogenase-like enzyme
VVELGRVAPGVEIRIPKTPAEAAAAAADADGTIGWFDAEILRRGAKLRWVQHGSAGVEGLLRVPGFAESSITLTNAQRIYGPPVGEHAVGLLMALTRRIEFALPLQRAAKWDQSAFPGPDMPELGGKTLLIAGLGGLGTEVARIARGFGMRVLGTRNVKGPPTELAEYVGGPDELLALARQADFVINCLPLTPATRKVFGAELFAAMKPTAFFVNVGRGGTVDTDALIEALETKRLAGAGFDVTDPEPLPPEHPLWALPNVVITPHVGSGSEIERERLWLLVRENLRRFAAGEPLLAVVDKRAGY